MKIISSQKQRISKTYIIKNNNKFYFIKKYYSKYPKSLITSEFKKSKKIYNILKKNKFVNTPKPLKINKNKIIFEYIPNTTEIKKFLLINNNIFFSNKKKILKILKILVRELVFLHKNLKLNDTKTIYHSKINGLNVALLTDLCNSNILIKKNKIYLIDFSPSQYMFPIKTCNIMGSCYFDLVYLIYAIKYPPLIYRLIYNTKLNFEKTIINYYFKYANQKLNNKYLTYAKKYYLKKYLYSLKKENLLIKIWWKKIIEKELKEL